MIENLVKVEMQFSMTLELFNVLAEKCKAETNGNCGVGDLLASQIFELCYFDERIPFGGFEVNFKMPQAIEISPTNEVAED